jgi:hypothetical protein
VATGDQPAWLIAERAQPLVIDKDSDYLAEQVYQHIDGLEDIGSAQLGYLHGRLVLLDYGNPNDDLQAFLRQFEDPLAAASLLD